MIGTPRPPSFLAALTGGAAVRPAFTPAGAPSPAQARPAFRGGPGLPSQQPPPPPEPPPGPSAEELAALRAEAMQQVAHGVEVLRLQAERLAEQARSDAIEIGFQVARRILEAELTASPQALFALVRSALKRAGDSRKIVVRLHPEDAGVVTPALAAEGTGLSAALVEVAGDPTLEPGDVVVDTDFGKVDGRLRTRFEELYRAATAEEGAA